MDLQGTEIRFGEVSFSPRLRNLVVAGQSRRLQPKAASVLQALAGRIGHVVSRAELIEGCWGEEGGSDEALTQVIAQLRRALGDEARAPRYIETVSKDGYRLLVVAAEPASSPLGQTSAHARAAP